MHARPRASPRHPAAAGTATTPAGSPGALADPATYQKRTEFDNTPWRFDMNQNGRRMTAEEFDAWMKAKGIRVATGKPAAAADAPAMDSPRRRVSEKDEDDEVRVQFMGRCYRPMPTDR